MKTFFRAKNGHIKTPAEKPRFFKQIKEFQAQEALSKLPINIFHDRLFWIFLVAWAIPIIASLIYSILNLPALPNQIPLLYSQPWGENQLSAKNYIFLPTMGVLVLGLFNFAFAGMFHPQNKVFSYLLIGAASLLSLLSAITIFNIINLMR